MMQFIKRNDGKIAILVFLMITFFGAYRGYIYSEKLNNNSRLAYAKVYKISSEYYSYKYLINNKVFEGKINNSRANTLRIGDTIVIQYYQIEPVYHVVYSIQSEDVDKDFSDLPLKKINIWDAW